MNRAPEDPLRQDSESRTDEQESRTHERSRPQEPARQPELVTDDVPVAGKPDTTKRAIAMIIDAVAAVLVGMIPVIGGLIATAYWLVRDGLDVEFMPNRSLGKKVAGLQPVTLDGRPVDLETSMKRNWPFAIGGVAQILLFIPIIGWLLMVPVLLVALGIGLAEVYFVLTDPEGRRIGDRTADTRVREAGEAMF